LFLLVTFLHFIRDNSAQFSIVGVNFTGFCALAHKPSYKPICQQGRDAPERDGIPCKHNIHAFSPIKNDGASLLMSA
jgi:hypothetical protein